MNLSTRNGIKGKLHEVDGNIKEKLGQIINDPDLEAEGNAEQIAGKIQKKVGQIEKVIEK